MLPLVGVCDVCGGVCVGGWVGVFGKRDMWAVQVRLTSTGMLGLERHRICVFVCGYGCVSLSVTVWG